MSRNWIENSFEKLIIHLPDNSIFRVIDKSQITALKMKLTNENLTLKEFTKIFVKEVERHWKNKTVPTKFDFDITWEKYLRDKIFDKYYRKFEPKREKEIREKIGEVSIITGMNNFEREVKENNLQVIEEGVAKAKKPFRGLIIAIESQKGKLYEEIWKKYFSLAKEKADAEFKKRRKEAERLFKNQAELAEKVFYQYIRPYLFGVLLGKMGGRGSIITSEEQNRITLVKGEKMVSKKLNEDGCGTLIS